MKTAVISGVSRGIGRALAEKFLVEGYFVIGTSRSGTVDYEDENLRVFPLELISSESIEACVASIAGLQIGIDVFINNAGIWDEGDDQAIIDPYVLRHTLEANVIGPIHFGERISSLMNNDGHIVNISSRRGSCGWSTDTLYPAYSISKAGLNMYTRKLAVRLDGKVTVSAVHPGVVKTDMNPEGEMSPRESADDIYKLIHSNIGTGKFWSKGEQFPW